MIDRADREGFLRRIKRPHLEELVRTSIFKKILVECKKNKHCPHCDAYNGTVKKMPGQACKIVQAYPKKGMEEEEDLFEELDRTFANNPVMLLTGPLPYLL